MKFWKYFGIGVGGLVGLVALGFLALVVLFFISSRRGYAKIETLKNEYAVGLPVDSLIERCEQLGIDEIWWNADGEEKKFETGFSSTLSGKKTLEFKLIHNSFQSTQSGTIHLLAFGSLPIERFILSLTYENRKITKSSYRIVN